MNPKLFALERYDRSQDEAPTVQASQLTTTRTRLVGTLHLPADDVVLVLIEGPDAETVREVAEAAGWRVDRMGPARWIHQPRLETPNHPGGFR